MESRPFTHFVFVDFENVPKVDLEVVEGKPVHVTLLIGKKQTWLDLPLVQQIHRLAAQVALVEVGASGRNALDLTLACYLGQAVQRSPGADFAIVSKDKDFEAMIGHLQHKGIRVRRHDSFAALPFLQKPKKPAPVVKPASPAKISAPAKTPTPVQGASTDERLEKLISMLKNNTAPRPKKMSSLLARIGNDFGNKLTEAEQGAKLTELIRRGVLTIDAKGKVSYSPLG